MCFQKRKSAMVGVFLEKNPMTNKIKKFLFGLEHLIPDGRDEIPTFALYHPLLTSTVHGVKLNVLLAHNVALSIVDICVRKKVKEDLKQLCSMYCGQVACQH